MQDFFIIFLKDVFYKRIKMIFDTHAHYDDEAFDSDREELLESLPGAGIGTVVNIAASPESIDECLELAHKYPHVYCALGIHPEHCAEMSDAVLEEIFRIGAIVKDIDLEPHTRKPSVIVSSS